MYVRYNKIKVFLYMQSLATIIANNIACYVAMYIIASYVAMCIKFFMHMCERIPQNFSYQNFALFWLRKVAN